MPHSLIINLIPRSPISLNYSTGKHLHALFLKLISSVDRDLGSRLHEQKTDKAFTISPLQVTGDRGSNETVQNWTTLAKRAFLLSINLVLLSISSSFCLPRTKN
jgi:CRISPR-associated endoribonuclease Cas6